MASPNVKISDLLPLRTQIQCCWKWIFALVFLIGLTTGASATKDFSPTKIYPRFEIGVTGIGATIENLEIKVSDLVPGSPAASTALVAGDILTSVSGSSLNVRDPRVVLGNAITAAEATNGQLVFGVQGKADVTVTIPVIGAYVPEWPKGNCPKSAAIVDALVDYVIANQLPDGSYDVPGGPNSIGDSLISLFLLSTGDDSLLPNVQLYARRIAESSANSATTSSWALGYFGILLGEYYLRTGDSTVLPGLQAICDRAVEQQMAGGWGHGQNNNPGYVQGGLMNNAGVPVLAALIFGRECGLNVDDEPYERALKLMYRIAGHGKVPYGDHRAELGGPNGNGREGMLACAFTLLDDPVSGDGQYYQSAAVHMAMVNADSYFRPEDGHTGGGFNVMWRGISSALVPAAKDIHRQRQMANLSWYYDLSRKHSGGFSILPTPPDNGRYSGFNESWGCGSMGLTYTATRGHLRITGAPRTIYSVDNPPPAFSWGNAMDREYLSIEHAAGFGADDDDPHVYDENLAGNNRFSTSLDYCAKYLRHYNPMTRNRAAELLRQFNNSAAYAVLLEAAQDPDTRVRRAAFDALGGYRTFGRPMARTIPASAISSSFMTEIEATLNNPDAAWWEVDGALLALGNALPEDARNNIPAIKQWIATDEPWLRESAFIAMAALGETITPEEFGMLTDLYADSVNVHIRGAMEHYYGRVLNSNHNAFQFGQRGKSARTFGNSLLTIDTPYDPWVNEIMETSYNMEAAQRTMIMLDKFDPIVYRYLVDDIVRVLANWEPGNQHGDWMMTGGNRQDGFLVVLNDHLGAYGRPVVDELNRILDEYDSFENGTPEQELAIRNAVNLWESIYDPYAFPEVIGETVSLTAYYDFEGDFNDAPGAGSDADNLSNSGVTFSTDAAPGGGSNSASFDGSSSLSTAGFTADLGPADSAYTVMFWIKAADANQTAPATTVLSTQMKAAGGNAAEPAWQVGGFGNDGTNGDAMTLSFSGGGPDGTGDWVSPTATGAVANDGGTTRWRHVAFVVSNFGHPDFSGDAYSRTFVDGFEVGVESKDNPWTDHPLANIEGALVIGGDSSPFTGLLDDVALFRGAVSQVDIAAIAAGTRKPNDPLAGIPLASSQLAALSFPVPEAPTPGGVSFVGQINDASGHVYVAWARSDQGTTDLDTWGQALGGGWRALGDKTAGISFADFIEGLDGDTDYVFRLFAVNENGSSWSDPISFRTLPFERGETLQIYICLGQSNMEGHAFAFDTETSGNFNVPTIEFLISGTPAANIYLNNLPFGFKDSLDVSWLSPRDDAWAVQYDSSNGRIKDVSPSTDPADTYTGIGPLSPGFGFNPNLLGMIGPELGFGTRLGDATGAPVFLFKSNKGGTTLGNDWRPPTAVDARGGSIGVNYTNTMNQLMGFLDQLDADLADDGILNDYNYATGYEIKALFWLQGFNEQFDDGPYTGEQMKAEYDENLRDLIYSIRASDSRIPNDLPIVIGESSDQDDELNAARVAAVNALNQEIPNSAAYFESNNMIGVYYGDNDDGQPFTNNGGFHFNSRAENYLEIGWLAGGAVLGNGYLDVTPDYYLGRPVSLVVEFNQVDFRVPIGGDADVVKVVWGLVDQGASNLDDWPNMATLPAWNGGDGNMPALLTGLTENTRFFYRVYAENTSTGEKAWSALGQVMTPYQDPPPVFGTPTISATRVTLSVSCDLLDSFASSSQIVWAYEDMGETDINTWTSAPGGGVSQSGSIERLGTLNHTARGLTQNQHFYARIIGTNYNGIGWSEVFRFRTARGPRDLMLTAYYDFEPDGDPYNDPAGGYADDLTGRFNPFLSSEVSPNAKGSTQSAEFVDGDSALFTEDHTTDLGPDPDAYTIMFWIKASDINQENKQTRLITTHVYADPDGSGERAWQIEGFGNTGSNGTKMELRAGNGTGDRLFSPDTRLGPIGALANSGQEEVWHHVAYVVSNSGDPRGEGAYAQTFLDGVSCGISSEEPSWDGFDVSNKFGQLTIGGPNETADARGFDGLLDDIAFFAGIVHADEIAAVANGLKSPTEISRAQGARYDTWIARFEVDGSVAFLDDPDQDGINGLDYVLDGDPTQHESHITEFTASVSGLSFEHKYNADAEEVTLGYEWSTDLNAFYDSGETVDGLTVTITSIQDSPVPGRTSVSVTPNGPFETLFVRATVSQ
ncbi:MAG: DUF6288 domain-containing protein [Verrucomicrobiota bacterium]